MGSFTHLVFGAIGGMGADCNCFLKRLAESYSYFYYCYYYYYYYYYYDVKFSTGILFGGEIAPSGLPASLTPNPMHLLPLAPLLSLISRSFESLLPGLGTFHTFQFLSAEYYYLREQLCPQ